MECIVKYATGMYWYATGMYKYTRIYKISSEK